MKGRKRNGSNPFLTRLRQSTPIGEADLAALEALLEVRRNVRNGVELVSEGKGPEQLHVLLHGWACRYKVLADGRRQIANVLLPGDVCDFDALQVADIDYAVATLTPCTLALPDRSAVVALAAERPGVAQALAWLGVVENAALTERTISLGRRSARERIAHLLCELFVRLAAIGQARDDGYALPLTQEDLADALGLSTIHVNRMLRDLREERLVTLQGRKLTIHDWAMLQEAGEFKPAYLHLARLNRLGVA